MDASNRRITNFDSDLKDGLVLASLILSHVPSVKRLTTIFWVTSEPEHYQRNAGNVIGAMKDLGLDYEITPNDIINPNPCGNNWMTEM